MASPFRTFRKYQKSALVALGIMAMLSFIILPLIMQWQDASLRQRDTTLATCQYGKISLMAIQNIRSEQQQLLQFYASANQQIGFDTQQESPGLQNRIRTLSQFDDESAIYHWLKIQKLKEQGYVVTRDMVANYLKVLTDDQLTEARYLTVLDAMGVSTESIIQLLQRDILAQTFDNEYMLSVRGITPIKEFEWFARFNRRSKIEAAALDVGAFVGEVKEPSEKELKAFFEANKFRVQDPSSSETGFAVPKQSSVEFISYNFDNLDINVITDEEARQYYEQNMESFRIAPPAELSPSDFLQNFPGATSLPFNLPLDQTSPQQNGSGLDLPTFQLPISTDPVTPESQQEPSAATPEESPTPEVVPAEVENGGETSSLLLREKSPFRLVAYQTESDAPADVSEVLAVEAEVPVVETPEQPVLINEAPLAVEQQEPQTTEKPLLNEETPVPLEQQEPQTTEPVSPYRPFEEVKDEIKETLARHKMKQKMDEIEQRMNSYYNNMVNYARQLEAAKEKNQELPQLERLDLKAIAAEFGLEFDTMTSRDFHSMLQDNYSFSAAMMSSERFSNSSVIQTIFSASGLVDDFPYRASNRTTGNQYLFWVTATTEQKVPEFTDEGVAEQVKKRWMEVQARPLARAKAEQIMEEVKKSGKPLPEFFEANPNPMVKAVVETDYFPWFDEPQFARFEMPSLRIAEVRESGVESGQAMQQNKVIVAWGNQFMEDVFALQKGELGVTVNQPENTFYVIHALEVTPGNEELVSLFESMTFQRMYTSMFALQSQFGEMYQAMNDKIQDATGFKWLETPTAYHERMQNRMVDE